MRTRSAFLLGATIIGSGCEPANEYAPPPPPKVTVATPIVQDVTEFLEFTGRFEAVEDVDIVARVTGFVEEIRFEDGQAVKAGTPMFLIDPREFEAAVEAAQAELERLEAQEKLAEVELQRFEAGFEKEAVSELEVIQARAEVEKWAAQVKGAKAALERAKLDLSYTQITSPITGLASRRTADVGDLVGPGSKPLTSVVRQNPIYLSFTASERDVLAANLRFSEEDRERVRSETGPPVYALLADGSLYDQIGRFDFIDNQVDPDTGTIGLRTAFPNPEGVVTPGLFARIRVPREADQALLVPESAVQRDSVGSFLLAVGDDNTVSRVAIERGPLIGTMRVITSGVTDTDRIIVLGIQRARPGIVVEPETTTLEPAVQPELGLDEAPATGRGG